MQRTSTPSFPSSRVPASAAIMEADGGALRSKSVTHYGFCSLALANPALDERAIA